MATDPAGAGVGVGVELQGIYDGVVADGLALVVEMIVYGVFSLLHSRREMQRAHVSFAPCFGRVLRLHGRILHHNHSVSSSRYSLASDAPTNLALCRTYSRKGDLTRTKTIMLLITILMFSIATCHTAFSLWMVWTNMRLSILGDLPPIEFRGIVVAWTDCLPCVNVSISIYRVGLCAVIDAEGWMGWCVVHVERCGGHVARLVIIQTKSSALDHARWVSHTEYVLSSSFLFRLK